MIRDLKFDERWIGPIKSGAKNKTLRYALDEIFIKGAMIRLKDTDGEVFAIAEATRVWDTNVQTFFREDHGGYPVDNPEKTLERLNEYYDDEISDITVLTAIEFEVKAQIGDYYEDSE